MHAAAYEAVAHMVELAQEHTDPTKWVQGLDLGGQDVNGTARDLVPVEEWTAVDLVAGPGVDIQADIRVRIYGSWDVVLCTEVLEHAQFWPLIIRTAAEALRPGGVLLLTCASVGRAPHSSNGNPLPVPVEWYENVTAEDLKTCAELFFSHVWVAYRAEPADAYLMAVR